MAYAPTLTASTDANPSPRCLVTFSTLAAGTQTINIYRVAEGRQFKMRGGQGIFAVGGIAVMDYEVPFGAATTYRAEMFDASSNSLGFTDATSITISSTASLSNPLRAWIHQPLKPTLAIQATILAGSFASIRRPTPGNVYYPEGATVGTRIGGQRQGLSGAPFNFMVDSSADADEFQSMLGDYTSDFPAVVCIRTSTRLRIPRTLFASIDPNEVMVGVGRYLTFQTTIDEVQPPAPGLVIPALRRKDIDFAFATRTLRAAAYATRLARDTDFTKAGLAG